MATYKWKSVLDEDDDNKKKKSSSSEYTWKSVIDTEEESDIVFTPQEKKVEPKKEEKKPGILKKASNWIKKNFTSGVTDMSTGEFHQAPKEGKDYTVRYDPSADPMKYKRNVVEKVNASFKKISGIIEDEGGLNSLAMPKSSTPEFRSNQIDVRPEVEKPISVVDQLRTGKIDEKKAIQDAKDLYIDRLVKTGENIKNLPLSDEQKEIWLNRPRDTSAFEFDPFASDDTLDKVSDMEFISKVMVYREQEDSTQEIATLSNELRVLKSQGKTDKDLEKRVELLNKKQELLSDVAYKMETKKNPFKAMWDALGDRDTYGAVGAWLKTGEYMEIINAAKKAEKGLPLTIKEQNALTKADILGLKENVATSTWYEVGKSIPGSIVFMLEFLATTIIPGFIDDTAIANARGLKKGAMIAANSIVRAAERTATIGTGQVAYNYLKLSNPEYQFILSGDKEVVRLRDGDSKMNAFASAVANTYGQMLIEDVGGEAVTAIGALPGLIKSKILLDYAKKKGLKGAGSLVSEIAKKGGWSSVMGEFSEEEMGRMWEEFTLTGKVTPPDIRTMAIEMGGVLAIGGVIGSAQEFEAIYKSSKNTGISMLEAGEKIPGLEEAIKKESVQEEVIEKKPVVEKPRVEEPKVEEPVGEEPKEEVKKTEIKISEEENLKKKKELESELKVLYKEAGELARAKAHFSYMIKDNDTERLYKKYGSGKAVDIEDKKRELAKISEDYRVKIQDLGRQRDVAEAGSPIPKIGKEVLKDKTPQKQDLLKRASETYKQVLMEKNLGEKISDTTWVLQRREEIENPERYRKITEMKNEKGIKIGDRIRTKDGEEALVISIGKSDNVKDKKERIAVYYASSKDYGGVDYIEDVEKVGNIKTSIKGKSIKEIVSIDNLDESQQLEIAKDVWSKSSGSDAFTSINEKIATAKSFPEVLKLIKEASGKNYDAVVSSYAIALDTRFGILREREATQKIKTQKEKVKETLKEGETKTIKQIAQETKILEPNVRRILGVGTKEGTFERVAEGVYTLTKDGEQIAYVQAGDALQALPQLAKEGFKADMIFLDIPYKTAGVVGGNRGIDYDKLSKEDFKNIVVPAVKKIARTVDSPIVYMYSNSKSGMKDMVDYNKAIINSGLQIVAKGTYTKTYKSGKPMMFGKYLMPPEGILIFNKSGKKINMPEVFDIKAVAPLYKGHYQTEKAEALLEAIIKGTTKVGDTVLDPFTGSGVAAAQAVKAGRKAVAIEINKKAVEEKVLPRVERAAKLTLEEETEIARKERIKRVLALVPNESSKIKKEYEKILEGRYGLILEEILADRGKSKYDFKNIEHAQRWIGKYNPRANVDEENKLTALIKNWIENGFVKIEEANKLKTKELSNGDTIEVGEEIILRTGKGEDDFEYVDILELYEDSAKIRSLKGESVVSYDKLESPYEMEEELEPYEFEVWAKKQKNLPEGLEKAPYTFGEWIEANGMEKVDVDPRLMYDGYVTNLREDGYEVFGNSDYGIRVLKLEPEPIIKDEADLSKEIVPKRKKRSAQYSAAMFSPEQQEKINEAIYDSYTENIEHSYLSNQVYAKKEFEPAGSVEEYKRRIDQMHKFGQLYAVPRRGGLQSPKAAGMFVSVPMSSKKRIESLKKFKLPETGEVRIKDRHLSPNRFGLEVLSHELAHALHYQITGSTGKSIRPIFDDGTMSNAQWQTILSELEAIEIATQGAGVVASDPTYYGKETEKFAYFLGAYVSNRPLVTKIAPNAIAAFVDQKATYKIIEDYLDATNEMIDKGAVVSKFIPDRRQRYQALLGKTVGDKAFMVEQIYKSSVDRSIVGISKLIKEKFKNVKDDPTTIYRAASGITHTTQGTPTFGAKEYVFPEKGDIFTEQELIGYGRLKYKLEVDEASGKQRMWKWAYSPKQAKQYYEQLSPEGKQLVKDFTADLTEAKDMFNRNLIAQTYKVDQALEGWIHRIYPKERDSGGILGWKRLQKKTASALQHRKLSTKEAISKGLIEDLQKSMLAGLVELETKKNFNQMVEQMFGTVVLPVAEGSPVKKGWIEVTGDIYTGIAAKFEKGRTVIVKDGKRIVPPVRKYQMPKDIYDRFKYYSDVSTEATLVSQAMDLLYKWWRINILTHPGTVATNFVGGGIQYMSKVVEDFYMDAMFMPGDIKQGEAPFAQTRLDIKALFAALSPKGWQNAQEWIYGGDSSTSFGVVRENKTAIDKANQTMDAAASKMLFTFNAVENYWKKVITYSVAGKGEIEQLASKDVFDSLTKEQEELMRKIYDNVDLYGYDYGNRAKLLEGYEEGSAGKVVSAIKPFATYLYKYEKHLESYVVGAFDPSLSPQKRIAKIMTLATMIGIMFAAQAVRDDEKETPEGDETTDPRLRARGRTYVGKDGEGNEIFMRTSKYPFADMADAIKAVTQGDWQTLVDISQDKLGALSPAAKLGLYGLGYTNDFEKYTPKEILFSDTLAGYMPFYRVFNDIAQATDPFKRKKEHWYQSFTSLIPLPGASEETRVALRGSKKTITVPAEGSVRADVPGRTTKDVDVRNYWQDNLLSFFTGIYITRINPEYAKAFEARTAKNVEKAKEKADYEEALKNASDMYLQDPSAGNMRSLYNALVTEKYGKTTNLSSDEKRGATQIRKDLKQQILLESDIPHPEFVTASGSNASKADYLADYKEEMSQDQFETYLKTLWKAEVISSDMLDILVVDDIISERLASSIKKLDRTGFF